MPTTAHDRIRRGPLAALLLFLSLFLTAGTAAANSHSPASAARLGPSRHGSATALLPAGTRNPLDDEASSAGAGPAVAPSGPALVTERLWERPGAEAPSYGWAAVPRPAGASYRARAPPAS